MELKTLQYLESIYRHRSFTKAANEHYISQPSISNAVQKLENELNTTLIDRNTKPLSFTANGEHFMRHVYNILTATEDAYNDMQSRSCAPEQSLTFAWGSTLGDILRPTLFTDFYEQHPDYQIMMVESTSRELLIRIQEGSLDLAYALIPDNYNPDLFETYPLQICEMYVCMSAKHPLAPKELLSLSDLKNEKIITFPPGAFIRSKIEAEFSKLHIVPDLHTVSATDLIQDLVNRNYGITLLPIDPVNSFSPDSELILRPLEKSITFVKGFILRRGSRRTAAMNDLMDYVKNFLHKTKNE